MRSFSERTKILEKRKTKDISDNIMSGSEMSHFLNAFIIPLSFLYLKLQQKNEPLMADFAKSNRKVSDRPL